MFKTILNTSAPILVMYWLSSLIGLSDMFYAGRLGNAAQAAVGIAEQIIFLSTLAASGLCVGIVACVSRSIGAQRIKSAHSYANAGCFLAWLLGIAGTLMAVFAAKPLFLLFGAGADVVTLGVPYLRICALANIPWVLVLCQSAIFRAIGLAKYSLYLWLLVSFLSIIGGGFIFFCPSNPGYLSLNALAFAWLFGSTIGAISGFYWLRICWLQLELKANNEPCPSNRAGCRRELLFISGPAALGEMISLLSNFALFQLFAALPQSASLQAAWSLSLKIEETFAVMPLLALSLTAATLVGQNLGAKRSEQARKTSWRIAILGTFLMIFVGLILNLFSHLLSSFFSNNATVTEYTAIFLKTAPLMLPTLALSTILFGALEGAGCTWIPMLGSFSGLALVRLFLAWVLALSGSLGLAGVLIALVISRLYTCIMALISFKNAKGWALSRS
ncbi:MAG: MATE family efflux transporter [Candidatus Obscuribacterales bacterium]|nr:MATE family efflux transporter [Candidatus Obscuribacterales bacterium]